VNATVRALISDGLLEVVGGSGLYAHPVPTPAGRALLATPDPEGQS
jgi:hypothetical protein